MITAQRGSRVEQLLNAANAARQLGSHLLRMRRAPLQKLKAGLPVGIKGTHILFKDPAVRALLDKFGLSPKQVVNYLSAVKNLNKLDTIKLEFLGDKQPLKYVIRRGKTWSIPLELVLHSINDADLKDVGPPLYQPIGVTVYGRGSVLMYCGSDFGGSVDVFFGPGRSQPFVADNLVVLEPGAKVGAGVAISGGSLIKESEVIRSGFYVQGSDRFSPAQLESMWAEGSDHARGGFPVLDPYSD